jgi:hypothetical protein
MVIEASVVLLVKRICFHDVFNWSLFAFVILDIVFTWSFLATRGPCVFLILSSLTRFVCIQLFLSGLCLYLSCFQPVLCVWKRSLDRLDLVFLV